MSSSTVRGVPAYGAGFAKGPQGGRGFDSRASAAFGKKLPPVEAPRSVSRQEYGNSALRKATTVAEPVKFEEMSWPALSTSARTVASGVAKPAMSFVDMMKKRVAADEVEASLKAHEAAQAAAARKQYELERGAAFIAPLRRAASRRTDTYDDDMLESDLDYVKGDDTAGMLPTDTDDYYDEGEEAAEEDQDAYWQRKGAGAR